MTSLNHLASANRSTRSTLSFALLAVLLAPLSPLPATPAASPTPVLILHDSAGPTGWVGYLHAQMLANLLGHFDLPYTLLPVETYPTGEAQRARAVFYLGTVFDNPLATNLLHDLLQTTVPVCWFKYNLWRLTSLDPLAFQTRFGFKFDAMLFSAPNEIHYRGELFSKDPLDPELGHTTLLDPTKARIHAIAGTPGSGTELPYAIQSGRFWYLADSPFSFIAEEDRYLVFADLLHDILEIDHPQSHPALIRLEDIGPDYSTNLLYEAAAVLRDEGVPFGVAINPVHEDPFGVFNDGQPRRIAMIEQPHFVRALQHLVAQGGQILLHGYTHQYRDLPNPYSGVSGDDYEFFRVTLDEDGNVDQFEPVPEDTPAWAQARLDNARSELFQTGFSAVGWVTPHYTASPLDYRVFATNFALTVQRALYGDGQGHWASQFFPYPVARDVYGQTLLPENLGNVTLPSPDGDPGRTVPDLLRAARKNRVLRDAWAGAYFHPFVGPEPLRELVQGLKALGYQFVPVTTNVPPSICDQSLDQHHASGTPVQLQVQTCGSQPVTYQWHLEGEPLAGETNAMLSLPGIQTADLGLYTVRIQNAHGATVSMPIRVQFLIRPVIDHAALTNGVFRVWFDAAAGLSYFVEYQDFPGTPAWSSTFPRTAPGGPMFLDAPPGGLGQRFFRLRVE